MAGHRRARGTERAITVRTGRRRNAYLQDLAAARTPVEQIAAAAEHARGLLRLIAGEPEAAHVADEIVRAVTESCDRAVAGVVRRRR